MSPVQRPSRDQILVFETPQDLRDWFEANHDTASEAFIGHYRKGVPKPSATYAEAVEEALCFGWIDGITRRIDEEVHANRFTPRRRRSSWSAVNIARVAQLKAAGRMHAAGLRVFDERDRSRDGTYSYESPSRQLPPAAEARLRENPTAWTYWQAQAPSYRRAAAFWVLSAKREETRERRLTALIEDCAAGRPIKPLSY